MCIFLNNTGKSEAYEEAINIITKLLKFLVKKEHKMGMYK